MRWPLYFFELIFALGALVLALRVWRQRRDCWHDSLIFVPWLLMVIAYAFYLMILVIQEGWRDIPLLSFNAALSNAVLVAGPLSVAFAMGVRLWRRG